MWLWCAFPFIRWNGRVTENANHICSSNLPTNLKCSCANHIVNRLDCIRYSWHFKCKKDLLWINIRITLSCGQLLWWAGTVSVRLAILTSNYFLNLSYFVRMLRMTKWFTCLCATSATARTNPIQSDPIKMYEQKTFFWKKESNTVQFLKKSFILYFHSNLLL